MAYTNRNRPTKGLETMPRTHFNAPNDYRMPLWAAMGQLDDENELPGQGPPGSYDGIIDTDDDGNPMFLMTLGLDAIAGPDPDSEEAFWDSNMLYD